MDMSMRKGYRIAMGCIGSGMMALFALVGWDDEGPTRVEFFVGIGCCLVVVLLAIFWPQFARWQGRNIERLKSRKIHPHRERPVRTFLTGLAAFLLCGWMFYPTSIKEDTVLVLLAVLGLNVVVFLHGWWSENQGPKTAAAANLILFLLVGPLLLFSEGGPHYGFIPFGILVMAILTYGQYRHLKARADSLAATGQEESTEEEEVVITGSDNERVDEEE